MFEVIEQVDFFVEPLNGRFAFFLGDVVVEQQLFDGTIVARAVDLLYFIDSTHAAYAKHGDDFKFSIQDGSDWKRLKRHTICPYSFGDAIAGVPTTLASL